MSRPALLLPLVALVLWACEGSDAAGPEPRPSIDKPIVETAPTASVPLPPEIPERLDAWAEPGTSAEHRNALAAIRNAVIRPVATEWSANAVVESTNECVTLVNPSGDMAGATDWANLISALGSGCVVELGAGDFYLHKSLTVYDSDLRLRGQGIDVTNIRMAPGVEFQFYDPWGYLDPRESFGFIMHFPFPDQVMQVSDVTFIAEEYAELRTIAGLGVNVLSQAVWVWAWGGDIRVERVRIVAKEDPSFISSLNTNSSLRNGIEIWCYTNETAVVDNLSVESARKAMWIEYCGKAHVSEMNAPNIGGGAAVIVYTDDVEIENSTIVGRFYGINLYDVAHAVIAANELSSVGVFRHSTALIEDNVITQTPDGAAGVDVWYESSATVRRNSVIGATNNIYPLVWVDVDSRAAISYNVVTVASGQNFGVLISDPPTTGTVVDNAFLGQATGPGVYLPEGEGWIIGSNDFRQSGSVPGIWLGELATNNNVIVSRCDFPAETPTTHMVLDDGKKNVVSWLPGCEPPIGQLIASVQDLIDQSVLEATHGRGILRKLEEALTNLERGRIRAAINKLRDFIDQVEALIRSGRLPAEEGQDLIEDAEMLIYVLG